ncbi:MAG: STAS domain-containing protein [bacterium]
MALIESAEKLGDVLVVNLKGNIDISNSPSFRGELDDLISKGEFKMILNMDDVVYADSSGLGVLIDAEKKVRKWNGRLVLLNVQQGVMRTMRLTNLDKYFHVYEDAQEALNSFD